MSFENVTVKRKANIYFEGKVSSRSVITPEGEMKTLGMMLPGTYRFTTEKAETIDVTQGSCRVKIAEDQNWTEYREGESFTVPANSHFEIEIDNLLDYVCHFHE